MPADPTTSFYWHDYETWGTDPRRDRVAQFAGIRTDLDFNIIEDNPLVSYCKPAFDMLPQPGACLVTGISPQKALAEGMVEADFFNAIHAEMARPGTCSLGYNSIRFDDQFTRYGLYRNFFDPYEREWRNGNSRWDIIDMVRMMRALRPEGIEWPVNEQGVTSFRLEKLTEANGIAHQGAHDALSDVRATIELAKRVKQAQPRLFDYLFHNRSKQAAAALLNLKQPRRVLHVSDKYPARLGCIAVVLPLAQHPQNPNGIIVYDLRTDPQPLLDQDAEALRQRLYTPTAELAAGEQRIALKTVHINHAPVLAPLGTLTNEAREQWALDESAELRHLEKLRAHPELAAKIRQIFLETDRPESTDPDQSLYDGFLSDHDRRLCEKVRHTPPEQLADLDLPFQAGKLHELLFRYRARNWPELLKGQDLERWEQYRKRRLTDPHAGGSIVLDSYRQQLARLVIEHPERQPLLEDLLDWPDLILSQETV